MTSLIRYTDIDDGWVILLGSLASFISPKCRDIGVLVHNRRESDRDLVFTGIIFVRWRAGSDNNGPTPTTREPET